MFASKTKRDIAVGDHSVTIRKLSAHRLEEARIVRQQSFGEVTKRLGPDLMELITKAEEAQGQTPSPEQSKAFRSGAYDRLTVLIYGIDSWSVPENVTRENLEDLEESVVDRLFDAIMDLTFEDGETRKKD